jgi:hypothetical protein
VEWFKSGAKIVFEKNTKHSVVSEEVHRKGFKSVLVITGVDQDDLVNYTCRARSEFGSSQLDIILEPEGILRDFSEIITRKKVALFFLSNFSCTDKQHGGHNNYFHVLLPDMLSTQLVHLFKSVGKAQKIVISKK